MHARLYLYVTFGHQGIQAALHICNIRPLKVGKRVTTMHGYNVAQKYGCNELKSCLITIYVSDTRLYYTKRVRKVKVQRS